MTVTRLCAAQATCYRGSMGAMLIQWMTGLLRLTAGLALLLAGLAAAPPAPVDPALRAYIALAGSAADLCIAGAEGAGGGAGQAHDHACCLIAAAAGPDIRPALRKVLIPVAGSEPVKEPAVQAARHPAWQGRAPPVV